MALGDLCAFVRSGRPGAGRTAVSALVIVMVVDPFTMGPQQDSSYCCGAVDADAHGVTQP